ncbi:MAG TPA: GNAT family N-acetyltransferase [Longimicrobiales bacterium]|jgi:ribosomal protein S18 acetylase RimI-like enzyme
MNLRHDLISDDLMSRGVSHRPATEGDRDFLFRVYANTREEELAVLDWPEDQKAAFLHQQAAAQHTYYREQYPDAQFDVVELNGEAIGRIYLAEWDREFRVIDIALLDRCRGQGIGSLLMRSVLLLAGAVGKAVTIHVEQFNPARRLYDRLGFKEIEDRGVYRFLEWSPPAGEEASPPASLRPTSHRIS